MKGRVLITGGAGFIGSHVARALLRRGYEIRVLDSFLEQVHRSGQPRNPLLDDVEAIDGDVRDSALVASALTGVDVVIHLAAEVGVGQSMYAIERYVSVNDSGTAVLLEQMIGKRVGRLVVASSMSIYGEGLYRGANGRAVEDATRAFERTPGSSWDPTDADGTPLIPVPTPEWKRPAIASVYALTKYVQERLTMTVAPAYDVEPVALRLFNVYGPGQALSNPYTGVLAIFASRILNGQRPMIFEDGEQRRDFVHVEDIAQAFVLALEHPKAPGRVFNIGSGHDRTIREVALDFSRAMGRTQLLPEIVGKARLGDIRHCIADISLAQRELGFRPQRDFADSLSELADWVSRQRALDRVAEARQELESRGLVA